MTPKPIVIYHRVQMIPNFVIDAMQGTHYMNDRLIGGVVDGSYISIRL